MYHAYCYDSEFTIIYEQRFGDVSAAIAWIAEKQRSNNCIVTASVWIDKTTRRVAMIYFD